MREATDGIARVGDGCSISYRIHPQAGKPKLVLIHSLALDKSIWNSVVRGIELDFEVLVYDCRGHGNSERRPGPYSGALFGDDLAALLDHCGWESALIAGCSMGGCAALAFASAYPARTNGLALIDTTAWYGPTAPQDWRSRAAKAAQDGFATMIGFQVTRWFSDGFRETHKEEVSALAGVFTANDMACYQASCLMLGDFDGRGSLRSLRMPVSVIVGEEDYATPVAMAQSLHEAIPGSTLTVIKGGRHLTPVQCPEEIGALLKELGTKSAATSQARA